MLRRTEVQDARVLYEQLIHPDVYPFVRHKVKTLEEYYFLTRKIIDEDAQGKIIARTILNDWGQPIGTITLWDIKRGSGYLGTWIGKEFHGSGYNLRAKEEFFEECFFHEKIETIFLKIRKMNVRSKRATEKMGYAKFINGDDPTILKQRNQEEDIYDIYMVSKCSYINEKHKRSCRMDEEDQTREA